MYFRKLFIVKGGSVWYNYHSGGAISAVCRRNAAGVYLKSEILNGTANGKSRRFLKTAGGVADR